MKIHRTNHPRHLSRRRFQRAMALVTAMSENAIDVQRLLADNDRNIATVVNLHASRIETLETDVYGVESDPIVTTKPN